MLELKETFRRLSRQMGYDVVRYSPTAHPAARCRMLLDKYNIDLVLDVGANVGQFAKQLRRLGYDGKIVSFEPLSSAFQSLQASAQKDGQWTTIHCALGEVAQETEINVANKSYSSSILPMNEAHLTAAPQSKYVSTEKIQVKTLDSMFAELRGDSRNILLKIDTQGFEKNVLDGAQESMSYIHTLQLEMSFVPLYDGEASFQDLYEYVYRLGFRVVFIRPGFCDESSGKLLQMDAIFHRFPS